MPAKTEAAQEGTTKPEAAKTTKVNITLKLDKELLRRARVLAAENGTSVSALLAAKLEEDLNQRANYEEAKKRALAILATRSELNWKRPLSRDELHER